MFRDQPEISLIGVDLDSTLIEKARKRNRRLDRLTFEHLDFMSEDGPDEILINYLTKLNKTRFDVAFCFSITMWIHLNHGDSGLEKFLRKACDLAEMIVIEPQPWKCYRNAARRLQRAGLEGFPSNPSKLKHTTDITEHIDDILTRLCHFQKIVITPIFTWGRHVMIYEIKKAEQS